jgi:hypothetical protein
MVAGLLFFSTDSLTSVLSPFHSAHLITIFMLSGDYHASAVPTTAVQQLVKSDCHLPQHQLNKYIEYHLNIKLNENVTCIFIL